MKIEILGPFEFLPFRSEKNSLYSVPESWKPGIYFWTFQLENSYWINYIGIASNSVAERQSSHLSSFLCGRYDIYNVDCLLNGEIERAYSNGNGFDSFNNNFGALEEELSKLRFFFSPIDAEISLLKRIETGLLTHLRGSKELSKILDNGSVSRYRREDEKRVLVNILSSVKIKGIPNKIYV